MGVTYGVGEEKGKGAVIHTANHLIRTAVLVFSDSEIKPQKEKRVFLYSNKLRQADEQRV